MKNKLVTISVLIAMVLIVLGAVGLAYSFFKASVEGNQEASSTIVELDELRLIFTDTLELEMNEASSEQTVTKTFSVENISDVEIEYTIDITDLTNTFVKNEIVYTLTSTNGGATAERKAFTTSAGTLETTTIAPGVTQTYTIEVLFLEKGSDQNSNQGAIFSGKIEINSRGEHKYPTLMNKILESYTAVSDAGINFGYASNGMTGCTWNWSRTDLINCTTDESRITNGLYYTSNLSKTEDVDGDGIGERVYYYRGAVENNYVVFGAYQKDNKEIRGYSSITTNHVTFESISACQSNDYYNYNCEEVTLANAGTPICWRIVRTNEDGSVRLKYGGEATQNGETYTCPQTGTAVNIATTQPYVEKFLPIKDSINYKTNDIRTVVENWYRDNIYYKSDGVTVNTALVDLVVDTPYCSDMSEVPTNFYDHIYFGAHDRLHSNGTNKYNPQYKCPSSTYGYTVAKGDLTYPVGLLTADEVAYAGGVLFQPDSSNYLYTGKWFATMSPSSTEGPSFVFAVGPRGGLSYNNVSNSQAIVPVVSLKSEAPVKSGTGLYNDPFVIKTE